MVRSRAEKRSRKGFTLLETLGVVGIIAVLLGIAIPGLISIQKTLEFRKMNDYAREVFLAAQSNLTELRATGGLERLQADGSGALPDGAAYVPGSDNAMFPAADWSNEYCYTTGGTAFDLVLPVNSIDAAVRGRHIMIEYNPVTGNVYSAFYSEKGEALSYANVYRDEASRRELMLGYYAGTGLSGESAQRNPTTPAVAADVNGQEAIVKVTVPVPEAYINRPNAFMEGLSVSATVTGELGGGSFEFPADQLETTKRLLSGNTVEVQFCLDSLADQKSFASLAQNNKSGTGARRASEIASADSCNILPGDNLTIAAHFAFTNPEGGEAETFDDVTVSGINSLFGSLETVTAGDATRYNLYLSNGRHLQNLNALAPTLARKVSAVYFASNIYWNETVNYYSDKYGSGAVYRSSAAEAPARCLPYFVPVSSKSLFGEAHFSTADLPTLSDTDDSTVYAKVDGGNYGVYYLNIDASQYSIGKSYYAGSANFGIDRFTGLFSYVETAISNLRIVNPRIAGVDVAGHSPATGALVGATGHRAFLYGCSAYIDTADKYFTRAAMAGYGVRGYGAVGGLVGYAKSHNTVSGELENNASYLAFSNCFTALPVSGAMRGTTDRMYGYTNGVGGVVGCSVLTNFYNCYASGAVTGSGCAAVGSNGRYSMGAGGFVGTSHGTKYTNCFATGNVTGTGSDYAAGGFLGVMCHDEGFNYTNTETGVNTRITQGTIFNSCYAAGTVTANGNFKENFNGYNAPIGVSGSSYPRYPNYYDYCAAYGTTPTGEWKYLFKDSYYLNLYRRTEQTYSQSCSQVVSYAQMADLPAYQAQLAQNSAWGNQYRKGFAAASWGAATARTTHSYAQGAGSVYPFTKLAGIDYYGDWPSYPLDAGLAYYESYADGTTGFYFDRDSTSTLVNDRAIRSDGYAVLSRSSGSIAVSLNGGTATLSPSATVTIDNIVYYIYYLPYSLMESGSTSEFYTQFTATVGGAQYVMYFNPRFALTQVNPPMVERVQQSAAVKPETPPATISVRTVRQFCALSRAPAFWGEGYHYQQELNLVLSDYAGSYFDGAQVDLTAHPVGSGTVPFSGSYSGENGFVTKPSLTGILPSADGAGNYGLFGVIGAAGSVRGLTLSAADNFALTAPDKTVNAGILAGTSAGTISNITLTFNKNVTLGASGAALPEHAGLLAGANTGVISGCSLSVGGSVSVAGTSAGGLLGASSGTGSVVGASSVAISGDFTAPQSAQYAGAYAGILMDGAFSGTDGTAAATVGGTVRGGGTLGGFAGLLGGGVTNLNVALTGGVNGTGSAAGIAGEVRSARISTASLTLGGSGSITAAGSAGGVFGKVATLRASNVTAQLSGPVVSTGADASGFAVSADNALCTVGLCRVQLHDGSGVRAAGKAAGFYGTASGTIENSSVYMADGVQITGAQAAGFAAAQDGSVSNCSVTGRGVIAASGDAAGFVNSAAGTITGSIVSPVRTETAASIAQAYLGGSNDGLVIRGARAAGFVNGTAPRSVLAANAALGTVSGTQSSAGFASSNGGTLAGCMANTKLTGSASGFIASNESIVRNSYAWYAFSDAQQTAGFAAQSAGSVTGCYAAPLGADASVLFGAGSGTWKNCYGASGAADAGASGVSGITYVNFEALACVDPLSLDASGSDWVAANAGKAYPYSAALTAYPYAMLKTQPQYGDWVKAPTYAYGVAYYEKDAAGAYTYKVVDLSDPAQTVEGHSFSFDNIAVSAALQTNVAETGYAVFYHNAAQVRSLQLGTAPLCADVTALAALPAPTGVSAADGTALDFNSYAFRIISTSAASGAQNYRPEADNAKASDSAAADITFTGLSGVPVTVTPYYARAINAQNAYEVRTPVQLQNLLARPGAAFTITHHIDLTGLALRTIGTAAAPFTGSVQNGGEFAISHYTRTQASGDTSLFGTLQGAHLTGVVLTDAKVSVSAAPSSEVAPVYTVGILAGSADAGTVLDGCAVRGAAVSAQVENGPAAALEMGALAARSSAAIQNCSAENLAFTYAPRTAPDGGTDPAPSVFTVNMGGLVGTMQGGSLTASYATGSLSQPALAAGTHLVRAGGSVLYAGGAVGAEQPGSAAKAYRNSYAAVAVDETLPSGAGDAAGKFIGRVYNGAFTSCHGWDENTSLTFLGSIYSVQTPAAGPLYASTTVSDPSATLVRKADGSYEGFTRVSNATVNTYLATLTDCYYSKAVGAGEYSIYQQLIRPQTSYYTLSEKTVQDTAYRATRLSIVPSYSRVWSTVQMSDLIAASTSTPQATDYYYLPGGTTYYRVYATRVYNSGSRYDYTLWYYPTAGGSAVQIKKYEYVRTSASVSGVTLYTQSAELPTLADGQPYLVVAYNSGAPAAMVNKNNAISPYALTGVYAADSFTFTDAALMTTGAWTWTAYPGYTSYGYLGNNGQYLRISGGGAGLSAAQSYNTTLLQVSLSQSTSSASYGSGVLAALSGYYSDYYLTYDGSFASTDSSYYADRFQLFTVTQTASGSHVEGTFTRAAQNMQCTSVPYNFTSIATAVPELAGTLNGGQTAGAWGAGARYPVLTGNAQRGTTLPAQSRTLVAAPQTAGLAAPLTLMAAPEAMLAAPPSSSGTSSSGVSSSGAASSASSSGASAAASSGTSSSAASSASSGSPASSGSASSSGASGTASNAGAPAGASSSAAPAPAGSSSAASANP